MNGQKISNILTVLFLLAGLTLVGVFMVLNWETFSTPVGGRGTPLIAGIVAFVVTFLVLILITLAITFLKWTTNREPKKLLSKGTVIQLSKPSPKYKKISDETDSELVAVIMSAIYAYRFETGITQCAAGFRVREMNSSASSWRIVSRDEFAGVGGK